MAPLGLSLVNLLIESASLSSLAEGRQARKEHEFAQNSSSSVSSREPSTSPSNKGPVFFSEGNGADGTTTTQSTSSPTSSSPFPKTTSSSSPYNLNNNNYFGGASQTENTQKNGGSHTANNFGTGAGDEPSRFSSTQKLYSVFWEKFKKPYDQEEVSGTRPSVGVGDAGQIEKKKNKGEDFKNNVESAVCFDDKTSSSSAHKKFYEGAQKINRQLLPFWSLLNYPSDLHYYGRVAVMTVVTSLVIEKTLEKLPDIEQLGKMYGPYLRCSLLDGSDPNQPGRVGLDKDFF